jgi:hypothetical protein
MISLGSTCIACTELGTRPKLVHGVAMILHFRTSLIARQRGWMIEARVEGVRESGYWETPMVEDA